MSKVTVSESVIQCILSFYARNDEANYQIAKAVQDNHVKHMTPSQCYAIFEAEARCLAFMNDDLRFL